LFLSDIRKEKSITQQELADSIDKLRPVIQRIEGDLVNPSIYILREIAGGLKITLEELLNEIKL
jgi:transcriptional regulator with XRE-family HTH domain